MGGLASLTPFTYITMIIASLALAGFPFLSGFYSKDLIIEFSILIFWVNTQIIQWFTITAAMLTCIYSFRLLDQVFWANYQGFKQIVFQHSKLTKIEIVILALLSFLSLFSGYLFKDFFVGLGSNYFNNAINIIPACYLGVDVEFLSFSVKLLPIFLTLCAFAIENRFFQCKWFYNEIINGYITLPSLFFSKHIFEQHEKLFLEYNGPLFLKSFIMSLLYKSK